MAVTTELENAKRAFTSGDAQAAVRSLVLAWGRRPSSRIGALAIRVSGTLPQRALPDLVGAREQVWFDLAATPGPDVVHTLMAIAWPAHPRGAKARIEKLEKFPPDPRIAAALRDLWHANAYRSNAGSVFWRRAFRMLLHWKDPGTAAIVELAKRDDNFGIISSVIERRTKTPMPSEPELTEDESRVVTELEALTGSTETKATKDQLLEAVYAHPEDDGPRLVLADLVAEGDPRGELIQVQNAIDQGRGAKGKLTKRANALIHAYGRKWLDGLDAMVADDALFHCGFASDVRVNQPLDPTLRAWRTVRKLRLDPFNEPRGLMQALMHENLSQVTCLEGISPRTLAHWLEVCGPRRFDTIETNGNPVSLRNCEPHIEHLTLRGTSQSPRLPFAETFSWFTGSPLRDHVAVLELDGVESALGEALAGMTRIPTLRELWLRPRVGVTALFWDICITRDERQAPSVIDATWNGNGTRTGAQGTHEGLAHAIETLDETALTRVEVRTVRPVHPELQQKRNDALVSALRKQKSLVSFTSSGVKLL